MRATSRSGDDTGSQFASAPTRTTGGLIDIEMTPANEATVLDLAYVVMEKYRGGLGTTLAVLDETAKAIRQLGSDATRDNEQP